MSRRFLRVSILFVVLTVCPSTHAEEQGSVWPQLWAMQTGTTWVDLEHRQAVTNVVTVWISCALQPCRYEAFLFSVLGKDVAGSPILSAPVPINEINNDAGVTVKRVEYVTKSEYPGHFEFTLSGSHNKRGRVLMLMPALCFECTTYSASYAHE